MSELNNENVENKQGSTNETEQPGKYYTEEELALLLQKEGDKRISQYQKTMEKKNRQAEKLKNMSDEERYIAELEAREAAIEKKELELSLAENKAVASSILAEKGISLKLVDFVIDESADVMSDRIKTLDREFKASVKAEVEKRLGNKTPESGTSVVEMTKEQFKKLSLSEKQKLYNNDRELYTSLTN